MDDAATAALASLATEVAPDEVDLAPAMLRAWVAGGAARRDLFRTSSGGDLAAFGPGDLVAVLPAVLGALSAVGAVLLPVLTRAVPVTADAVTIRAAVLERRDRRRPSPPESSATEAASGGLESFLPHLLDALGQTLAEQGVPEDRHAEICLGVIRVLLADLERSRALVVELTEGA